MSQFTEVPIPIYGITAPALLLTPTTRSKFKGFICSGGSAGNLVFNDCATLEEASSANQILSYTAAQALIGTAGESNWLDWPLTIGLVVSALPTGGAVLAVVYSELVL